MIIFDWEGGKMCCKHKPLLSWTLRPLGLFLEFADKKDWWYLIGDQTKLQNLEPHALKVI